jgi:hypothetical protein
MKVVHVGVNNTFFLEKDGKQVISLPIKEEKGDMVEVISILMVAR